MKRNDCYQLMKLGNIPYLIPYGQSIADIERGIQLNSTAEFLWELLAQEHTRQELLDACEEHYQLTPEELPRMKADLDAFLRNLTVRGVLVESEDIPIVPSPQVRYLSIGGLNLRLYGPSDAYSNKFNTFLTDCPAQIHQTISLQFGAPRQHRNGKLLLRNKELAVVDSTDRYILFFPCVPQILEVHLSKDGSRTCFYCKRTFTDAFREDLFHAIRLSFLYLAQQQGLAVIHSASLLYQDRAWLFSGPSGTGKSTHTGLWHRLLQTPLINGDLNLLALGNGRPMVHGLPWCGTSGICDTRTYPLGGIILLKQSADDYVEELSYDKKLLLVQQRLIMPSWTTEMLGRNLHLAEQLIPHILVCRLHCTMNDSAVEVIQERIHRFLEEPTL